MEYTMLSSRNRLGKSKDPREEAEGCEGTAVGFSLPARPAPGPAKTMLGVNPMMK